MLCKYYFRHLQPSTNLQQYTQNQLEGIDRFLMKEARWQVEFSRHQYQAQAVIKVSHPWGYFQAEAKSDDFYTSIDLACSKLIEQIKKKKAKLQHHKKMHKSKLARLHYMNSQFEYHPHWERAKKIA